MIFANFAQLLGVLKFSISVDCVHSLALKRYRAFPLNLKVAPLVSDVSSPIELYPREHLAERNRATD